MLKEQVAELVKSYIKSSGFSEQDSLVRMKVLSHQILTLFKSEVDKLTVIDDKEMALRLSDRYISKYKENNITRAKVWISEHKRELPFVKEAQLKHTKKQLLDLMK